MSNARQAASEQKKTATPQQQRDRPQAAVVEGPEAAAPVYRQASLNPRSLSPAAVLALQRTVGNAAVNRLLGGADEVEPSHAPLYRPGLLPPLSAPAAGAAWQPAEPRAAPRLRRATAPQAAPLRPSATGPWAADALQVAAEHQAAHAAPLLQRAAAPMPPEGDASLEGAPQPPGTTGARPHRDTGLPNPLKAGLETLSGLSMDDVNVHYNSAKPAQVQALAYTQGTDIYVGAGQDKHVPHEAWHVVQQKQGRVKPTIQVRGLPVNRDPALEAEADRLGARAARAAPGESTHQDRRVPGVSARRARDHGSPGRTIQGRWQDAGLLPAEANPVGAPIMALREIARITQAALYNDLLHVVESFQLHACGAGIYQEVQDLLRKTLQDPQQDYATADLLRMMIDYTANRMRELPGQYNDDELMKSDHAEEDSPQVEEELITDPNHVNPAELQDEPDLLALIFRNIAQADGFTNLSLDAFREWYGRGPVTRSQFREILARHPVAPTGSMQSSDTQPMQLKRLPGVDSYQAAYTSTNYGPFADVTYTTSTPQANIDFEHPKSYTTWKNPQLPNSRVKLNKGSTRPGYGILNNGVETKLYRAGRSRHNMIANRLRPDLKTKADTAYTWHHLTKEYEMVLVDYMVHSKHGHNGGYLFWRDGQ